MLSRSGVMSTFLDIPLLKIGDDTIKVAYLYDIDLGTDRLANGYFRLYLKDINGNIIIARMFNLDKNDEEMYVKALSLKGHAIQVRFTVGSYNGSISLQVSEFKKYDGIVDYAQFIGAIDEVEESYEVAKKLFEGFGIPNPDIPKLYKTDSFFELCDGKAGGYMKLVEVVLLSITSLRGIPGIDIKDLVFVWYHVQRAYYKYLSRLSLLEVITNKERLEIITSFSAQEGVNDVCVDTLCGLLDISKPESLSSVIIADTVKSVIKNMKLACIYSTMLPGSYKKEGDLTLLKY